MSDTMAQRVVRTFELTADQRASALERIHDVVVTAGAGSGKTRTLVARYTSLLADGLSPRKIIAITFTEKAAREMRSRLRDALTDLVNIAEAPEEQELWTALRNQMDAARIGTIHGLCAELLRAHPAEAAVDPRFEILDENLAKTLKKQVVDETLNHLVVLSEYRQLFQALQTDGVKELLEILLERRLETYEIFSNPKDHEALVRDHISLMLNSDNIMTSINGLRQFQPNELIDDAGDRLAEMVTTLLGLWGQAEAALTNGDHIGCANHLFQVRRNNLNKNAGKKTSRAKGMVADLQDAYDQLLDPLIGGQDSKDLPPDREIESLFKTILPLIERACVYSHELYQTELKHMQALDFDDLEYRTVELLKNEEIRTRWRSEIEALLVDEFQDTNTRQREIIQSLARQAGSLFVVGDARQSIYRFRRADVAVFGEVQRQVRKDGGLVLDLDITYRAHEPLLGVTGDLLAGIMGEQEDTSRPYYVPFKPLKAHRTTAPKHISGPHIELVFGAGEDAGEARPIAARALALRLLDLREKNQIQTWDDVALLFRTSTGYSFYEDAFEDLGIPFVTVAGRGFYDRPEVRDILNILSALADPTDDLAVAGLLRSPAFGLSDSALYQLRLQENNPISYWTALHKDYSFLDLADQSRARRAADILDTLLLQVDRVSVADLLKLFVDTVDYRAILATDDDHGSSGRLWRNVDKLISDAQASGHVIVRDFLEYHSILNDADAREGEASPDAQGAVRLMTIHKSKGLEFPVVVLADSARLPHHQSAAAYLLPELGLSVTLSTPPMLFRLSKHLDAAQNDAEAARLLYVAMTRAKDKLLISGHITSSTRTTATSGWLKEICEVLELDLNRLVTERGAFSEHTSRSNHAILAWCIDSSEILPPQFEPAPNNKELNKEEAKVSDLYYSLTETQSIEMGDNETNTRRLWRVTGSTTSVPPSVIGQMTHKALELWLSIDDSRLILLLEMLSMEAGLATSEQRAIAVRRVHELIKRVNDHPLRMEITSAYESYHEVPYTLQAGKQTETGYIDLLYRNQNGWQVVDFKTDIIRNETERTALIAQYRPQMLRYLKAVEELLGQKPTVSLCFLDDHASLNLVQVA